MRSPIFTFAFAVLLATACDSPVGGPAGDGGAAGSPSGGGGSGASGGGGVPSAADRAAFSNYATKFVAAACTQALDCGLTPSLADCVSEAEADLAGYASCDEVVTYYKQNRAALEACLTATPSCEVLQSDGLCAAADGLDSADVSCADAGTGGGGGADGGGLGSDAGSDAGGGGGTSLTTDQAAVGAWAGGATCTDGVDTFQISFALLVCPGGRLRGAEAIDGFEFVDCGTWSTSGADLSLDYTATAVADPTFTDATTADFSYDESTDSLEWFSSCQLTLARVPGTLTEEDCESTVCSAGGTGPVDCGTDCDCGRCWYCESGTCRYGGEGDFGCFRGCGE